MLAQREFDDPDEAIAEAADHLLSMSAGLDRSAIDDLIDRTGVVQRNDVLRDGAVALPSGIHPGMVGRYVIRDDLLLSLERFLSFLKGSAYLVSGVLSLPTPAGIKTTADGVYSLYETFAKVAASAWRLSDEELAVVLALRRIGPSSADALANSLNDVGPGRVEAILRRLERTDDNPTGFVVKAEDGSWQLQGV